MDAPLASGAIPRDVTPVWTGLNSFFIWLSAFAFCVHNIAAMTAAASEVLAVVWERRILRGEVIIVCVIKVSGLSGRYTEYITENRRFYCPVAGSKAAQWHKMGEDFVARQCLTSGEVACHAAYRRIDRGM